MEQNPFSVAIAYANIAKWLGMRIETLTEHDRRIVDELVSSLPTFMARLTTTSPPDDPLAKRANELLALVAETTAERERDRILFSELNRHFEKPIPIQCLYATRTDESWLFGIVGFIDSYTGMPREEPIRILLTDDEHRRRRHRKRKMSDAQRLLERFAETFDGIYRKNDRLEIRSIRRFRQTLWCGKYGIYIECPKEVINHG